VTVSDEVLASTIVQVLTSESFQLTSIRLAASFSSSHCSGVYLMSGWLGAIVDLPLPMRRQVRRARNSITSCACFERLTGYSQSLLDSGAPAPISRGTGSSNPSLGSLAPSKNARNSAIIGKATKGFCPRFCPRQTKLRPEAGAVRQPEEGCAGRPRLRQQARIVPAGRDCAGRLRLRRQAKIAPAG
jgi:hypothetical protein